LDEKVHRRIAELALDRGYITSDELSEIMLEIGRKTASGARLDLDLWVDKDWLNPTEFSDILDEVSLPDDNDEAPADGADAFSRTKTDVRQRTDTYEGDKHHTPSRASLEADTQARESVRESASADAPDHRVDAHPPNRGDPTDTLTDLPVDYLEASASTTGDEAADSADLAEQTQVVPANDRSETSHSGGDGGDGDTSDDGGDSAGYRPENALLRAVGSDQKLDPGERFVLKREIGSGGSGRVVRAYDGLLGRRVAMKILRADPDVEPESLSRFIAEAQATGQLEHPNIVPIYDFGVLPNGNVFYTMREVEGESLRQVLNDVQNGRDEAREEYTLVRLLNILRQVTQATRYAHVRSVIHRDLKPDNIMLGDYGEVLVMDWGLAQIIESRQGFEFEKPSSSSSGQTLGTPSYMPPEQAKGDLERVDERSDIYSLGAILYEILTLEPPFRGDGPLDVMWAVVDSDLDPPSERAPENRQVPDELERICLKAMAKDQQDRYQSARTFHDDLEAWLEGLQFREAKRLVAEGDAAAERYHELLEQIEEYNQKVRRLSAQIEDWEDTDRKEALWAVEDERDETEAASARAFCQAVTKYTQALANEPTNTSANQGLADLYWTRLRRAEMRWDVLNTIYFKTLVEQYDPGNYEDLLEAHADLRVETTPEGAEVKLFDYEEEDRRMVPTAPRELGESPVEVEALPIGSYLLKFDHDYCRKIEQPVFVERDRDAAVDIRLPADSRFQDGFRFVPGGSYISGGDPDAFNARPPERVEVDPFFCQTLPVTFGDYLEWFNELYDELGDEAMARAPQTREAEGMLIVYDEDREMWIPDDILIEGDARERYPAGEGHEFDLPVIGIRAEDAQAYAEWLGERDGFDYRLPTVHEYEKAGRGTDGRRFPWGNQFDATFCKMRDSRPEKPPQPEPVGTFDNDISPYGVRDLAGSIQEWCQPTDDHGSYCPAKGGGWDQDERLCHLASNFDMLAAGRSARIGFRLAYEPDGG